MAYVLDQVHGVPDVQEIHMYSLITRFAFLFFIATTLLGVAYTLVAMAAGDSGEASKSLSITMVSVALAALARWEGSEDYIPEYQPKYLTR